MKKLFSWLSLFLFLVPTVSLAADLRTDSVAKSENVKNLYTAGQNVNVDADVTGDLNAAGSIVTVNGNVERTAQVAGSTVNVRGNVGGNVRIVAGTVEIEGTIGEDLVVFGGQVTVAKDAVVKGDLIIYGGTVNINGKIEGKIVGSIGALDLAGTVVGNVDLKNTGTIKLEKDATIGGKLIYSANQASSLDEAQIKGGINFTQVKAPNRAGLAGVMAGFSIFALLGAIILLFIITRIAPKSSEKLVESAFLNPWANVGIGFVALVVAPILFLFLAISIVGLPIAGIGFLAYVLLLALAGLYSTLLFGSWTVKFFKKSDKYQLGWIEIIVGVFLTTLFKLIPVLGWIIVFVVFLISLGAMTRTLFQASQAEQK